MGVNFADLDEMQVLAAAVNTNHGPWQATPLVPGSQSQGSWFEVRDPSDTRLTIGRWQATTSVQVDQALNNAQAAQAAWDAIAADSRAKILESAADLLEEQRGPFITMCVREAGKTLAAAVAEVREAVDFLRYYAHQVRQQFAKPMILPGPTGESNCLSLHGRGVFVCISPWNFPLAIFTG